MAASKRLRVAAASNDEEEIVGGVFPQPQFYLQLDEEEQQQTVCIPEKTPSFPALKPVGAINPVDFSHCFNVNHAIPENGSFGKEDVLALLFQAEFTNCPVDCLCKLARKRRDQAHLREIIGHKWHGGKLFLLCCYHSPKAYPEYLKLCQVNFALREQYGLCLKLYGRPRPPKKKRTQNDEMKTRDLLYRELSPIALQKQEEIRLYKNTVEWEKESDNGKLKVGVANRDSFFPKKLLETTRPPAVIKTEKESYYEVEAIFGSSIFKKKPKKPKKTEKTEKTEKNKKTEKTETLFYFVKWLGYPEVESSWEPLDGLQMSGDLIAKFNREYGWPTKTEPTIYSPEGLKIQKAINRAYPKKSK